MSEVRVKPVGKLIVLILVAGLGYGAYRMFTGGSGISSIIPQAQTRASTEVIKVDLPTINGAPTPTTVENLRLPSDQAAETTGPKLRWLHWAWNAQMGLLFANGGKTTTKGSLMADRGINIEFTRQDDPSKMQEALVEFATALAQGDDQPTRGAHFVTIMGDGAPAFLGGLNDTLGKLGPEYKAKIIGAAGFSRGEDKFMGPKTWQTNPAASKGGVVAGYLRDGDWNIAMKWLADNDLKNNPDEKTYDPDALNWVAANDYIDAAEKYILGYSEERPVVRNGKKTGEKKRITVDGVVTWTPGDVNVAVKKGGLVSIVSTKEYNAQMPCVIIGIDKWLKNNQDMVSKMLDGIFVGGDAVRSSSDALRRAAEISAKVYDEKDASYWERYAKGTIEKDATGTMVELGGSYQNNLTDNMMLFGLVSGSQNIYAAVYRVFGEVLKQQYPDLFPTYPPADQIIDLTYLKSAAQLQKFDPSKALVTDLVSPEKPVKPNPGTPPPVKRTIGSRSWNIAFDTGKATFRPESAATLNKLIQELAVATTTNIEVHGHTDNVGNPTSNMALSEARAFAVKKWLEAKAPRLFPAGRVKVEAHGQTRPKVENNSAANRAINRRVEIKITTSE